MKIPDYPSPCINCLRKSCTEGISSHVKKCNEYRKWFFWWWNFFRREYTKNAASEQETKFQYEHPDDIRRKRMQDPCANCRVKNTCKEPCPARLRWWDESMEKLRKWVGL